ncbi:DeoR family transcriptional regulator [Pelagibacteraceae bacterium]|nr:DeoR family transcriptional regulator [Pelagibacteraceae bacterium]
MSDKKEIKNLNNLTKVDFKKKELQFKDEFISSSEVHSILSSNFGRISDHWFKFSTTWNYNAYQTFMDMDKYLILIYLVQKSFRHYADIYIIHSEEQFYTKEEFDIEKINLIEISEDLGIAKETVRRKVNELNSDNILIRKGKRIILKPLTFIHQRPKHSIKMLSQFLNICSKYLATQEWFGSRVDAKDIEEFTRQNFTLVWRFFFRFKIPFLIRQRKFHGDLENFIVAGTIFANNIVRLKEKFTHKPITFKNNKNDFGEENFLEWAKFIITSKEEILGMNASSISEVTGIPRATVIRKIRISEKKGLIYKDKKQLYTIGKTYKSKLKDIEKIFSENQIDLCKFVSTFFELYRNPSINKNLK